jgi:hypothetical protein
MRRDMITAQLPDITLPQPDIAVAVEPTTARVSFRQPVSASGYIDAAWWPRSRDLTAELPALLDVLWTAAREITHVTYNVRAWEPAPRRLLVDGRRVRLGGFVTGDPHVVELIDAWGRERVDLVVIPAETDPDVAERALRLAGVAESPYRADEILARAAHEPGVN